MFHVQIFTPTDIHMTTPEFGFLLLHGYAGRPFEMSFLAEHLGASGYPVLVPHLAGHEGNADDFAHSGFEDWLDSAENALRAMREQCAHVVVVGFSLGGTLALALAEKLPVAGVVTIAAPVFLCRLFPYFSPDPKLLLSGIVRHVCKRLPASKAKPESRRIAPWEGYEGTHYVDPLHSFKRAAIRVRRDLFRITAPLMVLHGARDQAVHPDNAWEIISHVSSSRREMHILSVREQVTSGHLLVTHGETRAPVSALVLGFVRSLQGRIL